MDNNSLFDIKDIKTFQLKDLVGKTLKVFQVESPTESVAIGAYDVDSGQIYVLDVNICLISAEDVRKFLELATQSD
jgi:hypothetical protein